MKDYT